MTDDVIPFPKKLRMAPRVQKREVPFMQGAEHALRMIRMAHEDLLSLGLKRTGQAECIKLAGDELEAAIAGHVENARLHASRVMLTALGPGLSLEALDGARRALNLVLDILPEIKATD